MEEITGYKIWIVNRTGKFGGFDISTLAHDFEYTTSLLGQAGKLTFTVEKDPNGILQLEVGQCVYFWNGEKGIFKGYIFKISTSKEQKYSITAYDSLRYFQNHDFRCIAEGEKTLADMFNEICTVLQLPHKVLGKAKESKERLHKHNWNDVSYFDILNDCIVEMNYRSIAEKKYVANGTYVMSEDGDVKGEHAGERYNEYYRLDGDNPPVKYFIRDNFGTVELVDMDYVSKAWYTDNISVSAAYEEYKNGMSGSESKTVDVTVKPTPLIIGDKSLMTGYTYDVDIDSNTYNEIMYIESGTEKKAKETEKASQGNFRENWRELIREAKASDAELIHSYQEWRAGQYTPGERTKAEYERLKAEGKLQEQKTDGKGSLYPCVSLSHKDDTVAKWGLLRQIRTINSGYTKKQLDEYVDLAIDETNNIKKTLKIEALGYDGLNAGNSFLLEIRRLGVYDKNEDLSDVYDRNEDLDKRMMLYIVSVTHHYGENMHTMSLEVARPEKMTDILH